MGASHNQSYAIFYAVLGLTMIHSIKLCGQLQSVLYCLFLHCCSQEKNYLSQFQTLVLFANVSISVHLMQNGCGCGMWTWSKIFAHQLCARLCFLPPQPSTSSYAFASCRLVYSKSPKILRYIKAWEVQFLSKKYGVTKLLVSEEYFEISNSCKIEFMNVGTLI